MSESHDQLPKHLAFLAAYLDASVCKRILERALADPESHRDLIHWDFPGPVPAFFLDMTRENVRDLIEQRIAAVAVAFDEWVAEMEEEDPASAAMALKQRENFMIEPLPSPPAPPQPRLRLVKGARTRVDASPCPYRVLGPP